MDRLSSNRDLYDYLVRLADVLATRGSQDLERAVRHASRTASSNISTEFLGEARIALRHVGTHATELLSPDEREFLADVLGQLDDAFDRPRR